jgi:hypothetical protein
MDFKKALPLVTAILVVIGGILLGVQQALKTIDISTVPEVWQGPLTYLVNIFSGGAFAMGLVWLRNIFGYLSAKARKAAAGTTTEYDLNKFYQTLAGYMGSISIVFVAAPTPELKAIGAMIVFFIDLIPSVLQGIFPKQETAMATGPPK